MQKQHNRGQDGAGIASIKFDMEPGKKYIDRLISNNDSPIKEIFNTVYHRLSKLDSSHLNDIQWLKRNFEFSGELLLGHLRYGTFGKNELSNLHPVIRANNWKTRNLILAGNFNMTNVEELFNRLVSFGQFPVETSDTITILEKIGHFLDEENEILYRKLKKEGFTKEESTIQIAEGIEVDKILINASKHWDGGYAIAGMIGHGDAFVMRDPAGIRPAYYYKDDEVVIAASEKPVIQTAFNVQKNDIHEVKPGYALIIRKSGKITESKINEPLEKTSCSFERIYFSRGSDEEIYKERKLLGRYLTNDILKSVDFDIDNTVFSYIPNTASAAFYGLTEALYDFCDQIKSDRILELGDQMNKAALGEIFKLKPRIEKIAVKDAKLRTFITNETQRDDLVGHVYDVTYGVLRAGKDNLVVIDDSIVRGTTLKNSIIRILDRLGPKQIIVASSAPQIRYPDCYGIDMAKLSDFIAFRAAIELLYDTNQQHIINEVYNLCRRDDHKAIHEIQNHVKKIYQPFTALQISSKIAEMLTTPEINADIKIIYQSIENLHNAIPNHLGDWYFTGNYPTPGGNRVVNKSFIYFVEGKNRRAY